MKRVATLQKLEQAGIIAVIRADLADQAFKTAQAVIAGGIRGVEITFTVPHADRVIGDLATRYGDAAVIGAGTVLDATSARIAIIAGAQYVVSPSFDQVTAEMCNLYQIPYLPGCYTLTEISTALKAGADIIKLFPGSLASPAAIKAIKGPLPQVNLMPTGGVKLANLKDWFTAGAVVVGVGGDLTRPAVRGDYEAVTQNAQAYVAELRAIRA